MRLSIILLGFLIAAFQSFQTQAVTLEELAKSGDVKVEIRIDDEGNTVVGQELTVGIKFATQTWFKGSNRFVLPEVQSAVVTQRDAFGTNETRREGGISWVMQEKRFSVFPQSPGEFTLPPIKVTMKVHSSEGDVEGELYTKPITFNVSEPAELVHVDQWWAASAFTIDESWNKNFEGLKPGFSIKRTITIKADGLLAMMLPEVNHPPIKGLAHYVKTPKLKDDNTRGNKLGTRVQDIDYVVEESGEVTIPAVEITWFNTKEQRIEVAKIESQTIVIGELSPQEKMLKLLKRSSEYWLEILLSIFGLIAAYLLWRKLKVTHVKPRYQSKQVKGQLAIASYENSSRRFIKWAYVYLDWFVSPKDVNLLRPEGEPKNEQLDKSFEHVFGNKEQQGKLTSVFGFLMHKKKKQGTKAKDVDLSMNPK